MPLSYSQEVLDTRESTKIIKIIELKYQRLVVTDLVTRWVRPSRTIPEPIWYGYGAMIAGCLTGVLDPKIGCPALGFQPQSEWAELLMPESEGGRASASKLI